MTTMTHSRRTAEHALVPSLTPRRERLEQAILNVLRAAGTRSELREHVIELSDYLRTQGLDVQQSLEVLRQIGQRATPFMAAGNHVAVGDAPADRIAMMARWMSARYHRAD